MLSMTNSVIIHLFENTWKSISNKAIVNAHKQFSFTKNCSTQYKVVLFYEAILNNFYNRTKSIALLFDLQKAFDVGNHQLFLKKLSSYGLREPAKLCLITLMLGKEF